MAVMMKKIAPLSAASLLAVGSLAGAAEDMKTRDPKSMMGVINPAVRPYIRGGADLFITGDALYWKASADGLEYACEANGLSVKFDDCTYEEGPFGELLEILERCCPNKGCCEFPPDLRTPLLLTNSCARLPDHRWDWGFRVGLGANTVWDGWDIYLAYTRFSNSAKDKVCADDCKCKFIIPVYTTPLSELLFGAVCCAGSKWKLQLDMLDLEIGREFYTSKYVTLRPFWGVRGARVNQRHNICYQGGVPSILNLLGSALIDLAGAFLGFDFDFGMAKQEFELRNKFTGAGPRIGLNSTWGLGGGFRFLANAALNLLYGTMDTSVDSLTPYVLKLQLEDLDIAPGIDCIEVDSCAGLCASKCDKWHTGKAITDLGILLEWVRMMANDRVRLALHVGYEHHLFINQSQWLLDVGGQNQCAFTKSQGDLSVQGWVFGGQLDF